MTSVERKIDDIRACLNKVRVEQYPLVNPLLAEKDEYIKSLYLRVLCFLIRNDGETNNMQALFIRRLISGIKAEQEFQEYMKLALDIGTLDIEEFVAAMKKDDLKYFFCVDGIMVLSFSDCIDKKYGLFAELIEVLGVGLNEIEYLSLIATAIMEQDSKKADAAFKMVPNSIEHLSFFHCFSDFYSGAIINTDEKYYLYSPDKREISFPESYKFTSKRVIFENITINVESNIVFEGCNEVVLRKCNLEGGLAGLRFNMIDKVRIEKCKISGFANRFAVFSSTKEIEIIENNFKHCGATGASDERGGVINIWSTGTENILLENNVLSGCYIARSEYKYDWCATGIFVGSNYNVKKMRVVGNKFVGCRCRNNGGNYKERYIALSVSDCYEENNVCIGDVKNIV